MIATILPSSSNFHAVEYNEMKVAMGKAELVEMSNFGYISQIGNYTPADLTDFLVKYSSTNDRIKNAQFHLAISCKGNECSQEELIRIAKQYLKGMGYGEPGQPILIYAHHDTENNHIHVITSRVDPHGKKINHNHERLRSQEVINKIMGINESERISDIIMEAFQYSFTTLPHFRAILETMGYECFPDKDELIIKRGGTIRERIKVELIESKCQKDIVPDKKRIVQIRAILKKYRDMSSDKKELQETMKSKFGIDLLFIGSKDKPYGYLVVDHKNKMVYKGIDVLKLKELLRFQTQGEKFQNIDSFIDKMLDDNRFLTTKELNKLLRRQFGCNLINGRIISNGISHQIPDYMMNLLKTNDKRNWLLSFCPSTEEESDVLCNIGKYYHPENIALCDKKEENIRETQEQLKNIFDSHSGKELWDRLHEDGYVIVKNEDNYYCIDLNNRTILNMDAYGLDLSKLSHDKQHKIVEMPAPNSNIQPQKLLNKTGGSTDNNREWEVGNQDYDEIDDERKLKR